MDTLSQLQSHPLFKTFAPDALAEAVRAAAPVSYESGEVCIEQDEAGDLFGVLISGRLEAVARHGTGQRRTLGFVQPGECFGEMSLLTGSPTGATLIAATKSEAIVFLQEAIAPLIAGNREAVALLTRLITRRLATEPEAPQARRAAAPRYSLGASAPMRVLAVSCRIGDVRYCYFDTSSQRPKDWGFVVGLGRSRAVLVREGPKGKQERRLKQATHEAAVQAVLEALADKDTGVIGSASELSAIGHRVAHGGLRFDGPAVVDEQVTKEIKRLAPFAPLDNEYNLLGIEACTRLAPGVPQVAVFDTAFHATIPPAAYRYALPQELAGEPELRRFGFHGISHEGAARAAAGFLGTGLESLKMVTCHLGNGASMTAIDHGRSVDNTMGMTSLEGLVMSTRCGDIDPGLILHLVQDRKIPPEELKEKLYMASGLLGLSGVAEDVLSIMQAAEEGDPKALLALQVYCQRGRKYLSAYVGLLGGVDAIVFTGGVGANAPGLRARMCQGLQWLGVFLNEERNRAATARRGEVVEISEPSSRARVLVIGSDEEQTIAVQTIRAISQKRVTDVIRSKRRRIPISTSAHHVHLTQEHVEALFGPGHELTWHADLSQPDQFACKEAVSLIGPKARIDRVRVLGPIRPETQVEISRTEEYKLGIDAPIRMSGDLDGTPGITLEGTAGQVRLDHGVICAKRHIHMSPQDAMGFAVRDHDVVRVRVAGPRSLIFGDVVVRVRADYKLDMHIDTDEANAAELEPGTYGYLDSIQERAAT